MWNRATMPFEPPPAARRAVARAERLGPPGTAERSSALNVNELPASPRFGRPPLVHDKAPQKGASFLGQSRAARHRSRHYSRHPPCPSRGGFFCVLGAGGLSVAGKKASRQSIRGRPCLFLCRAVRLSAGGC